MEPQAPTMSVKVIFEIGHEASFKTRPTPEGYTHDWELFVRGCDGSDISHFVDKVVFALHESYPNPNRVLKEPPYTVKEQGFAGFILQINIYFKNKGDEPKKKSFSYDLDLQSFKVQREEFVIANPSDDFKTKLLNGGGALLNSGMSSLGSSGDYKSGRSSGGGENDSKVQNTFATLFGQPITKDSSKVSPDPAKQSSSSSNKTSPNVGGSDSSSSSKNQQTIDHQQAEYSSESTPTFANSWGCHKKRKSDDVNDFKTIAVEGLQKAPKKMEESDSFQSFGNYVAAELRRFPDEYAANRIQRKVARYMLDCIDEEEKNL